MENVDKAGEIHSTPPRERADGFQANTEAALQTLKYHKNWDPNLPDSVYAKVEEALHVPDAIVRDEVIHDLLDNSPYPEVRAAVSNVDEGGHSNTLRAWLIGLLFATVGSALNALFNLRQPYIVIPPYIAQVLAYPMGKAWERFMPRRVLKIFRYEFALNPGPFSKKEHAIAIIMANATWGGCYLRHGYHSSAARLLLSSFRLGLRDLHVHVGYDVGLRSGTSLFTALHDHSHPNPTLTSGWTIGRYRFFLYIAVGCFCWQWLPGYIAPFLSTFAWVTWIKPQNVIVNQLFGSIAGLSLIPITFDWSQIAGFNFSPLIAPWHAIANTLISMVFWYWIIVPAIHYYGLFYSDHLPISGSASYDNMGASYNVSRILTPSMTLDEKKYQQYSPIFLSTSFMLSYGLSFAGIVSVVVYTGLFHGREVWSQIRHIGNEPPDIHTRLMIRYKSVPQWWYGGVALIMVPMSFGVILGYPTHLTWWAYLVSILLAVLFVLPIGIINATTNISIGLNVISEFIIGYMQPGRPTAMMLFKSYAYISMNQALTFLSDMKLGHYMKIPPRVLFSAQIVAGIWSTLVQVGVTNWALSTIPDICKPYQKDHYICPGGRVFFTASVIWGLIGPARIFSIGQLYSPLMAFWIPGLLLPIAVYLGARWFPKSPIRLFSPPIFFSGTGLIPPATPLNYLSWGIVGYIFQKFLRDTRPGWWSYYKNIVSAGLDVGLAAATIMIFLALQLPKVEMPEWWGVTAPSNTLDAANQAIRVRLPKGQKFGPDKW
ncbi:Sexual differentiation process protein isp4 [Penicillium chermesinum]|nr:Sexual differentiation process protein isp4 [Penicillium chermesinum]